MPPADVTSAINLEASGEVTDAVQPETWSTREWIVFTVLPTACCVATAYLTLCQIVVLGYKIKKKKVSFKMKRCADLLKASNLPILMSVAIIVSGALGVCYLAMSAMNHYVAFRKSFYSGLVCCLMLSFMTMYIVLWLRQTSFYTEPAIRRLTNKSARYFSLFQGAFIVCGSVAFTIIQVQQIYRESCVRSGCISPWVSVVITASQLEMQIALLALFIWPLIKHRQNMKGTPNDGKQSPLMALVKRAVIVTAASIVIDVASIIVYSFTRVPTAYNVATVLNLACTIACFGGYGTRFLPCFLSTAIDDSENSSSILRRKSSKASVKINTLRCDSPPAGQQCIGSSDAEEQEKKLMSSSP